MLKKILIVVAILIAAFLVVAAFQPSEFRVVRSATIAAPAPVVFAQVNDLHKWQAWSPYEKLDPAMTRTFSGPASGVNASYAWVGNSEVGEGRMTVLESRPNEQIHFKLEFFKPFASTADAEFIFKPDGNRTTVMWSMSGPKNFVSKVVCMFMSMDKMIGGQFEEGLAKLNTVSVAAAGK